MDDLFAVFCRKKFWVPSRLHPSFEVDKTCGYFPLFGQEMKKSSLIERVEELGAGIFVQERNMLSRLDQNSVHRAFSEKVIVWFEPYGYQEENLDEVLDAVAKLPSIWSFRFPNVKVPSRILSRIRSEFPNAHIY